MSSNALTHDRNQLIRMLGNALQQTPGVIALYTFGSIARHQDDCYSDLDLQLVSIDLDQSISARGDILAKVAPIVVEWIITRSEKSWAATILLEGMNPYHKLDIGFCTEDTDEKTWILNESTKIWTQEPPATFPASAAFYSPDQDSVEHIVIGELLGLTRYVKARHRHQDLVCWKFFSSLVNRALLLEYIVRLDTSRSLLKPLATREYSQLQQAFSQPVQSYWKNILTITNAHAMNRNVVNLAHMLMQISSQIGQITEDFQREGSHLLTWLQEELAVDGDSIHCSITHPLPNCHKDRPACCSQLSKPLRHSPDSTVPACHPDNVDCG